MATNVPSGQTAVTLSAAGTAQFADRYQFFLVTNTGASAIFASGNPTVTTPSSSTIDTVTVPAGGSVLVANGNPLWNQSSNVLLAGASKIPTGGGSNSELATSTTVTTSPAEPGRTYPMMASGVGNIPAGSYANPGSTISVSGAATIAAAG